MTEQEFVATLQKNKSKLEAVAQAILKRTPIDSAEVVRDAIVDMCQLDPKTKTPRYRLHDRGRSHSLTWVTEYVKRRALVTLQHHRTLKRKQEVPLRESHLAQGFEEASQVRVDVQAALAKLTPEERHLAERLFLEGETVQELTGYWEVKPEYHEWEKAVLEPLKEKLRSLLAEYGRN